MSAVAAWSYTATATLWKRTTRDGWTGVAAFGAPVAFACDYSAKAERRTDASGREFVSRLVIYTELSDVSPGDRVMLGAQVAVDPIAAGAMEVMAVKRSADTLDRTADDYELVV